MSRKIRKRIYLAVEGESEQSFVKFLQYILDQNNLPVHLDCEVLDGGGYKSMLKKAISYRSRREKSKGSAKSILIVDTDRADKNEDGWSLEKLMLEAKKKRFDVCLQKPNLEGLFLRMLSQNEHGCSTASFVRKRLLIVWDSYQKPADARTLVNKFSGEDLMRTATHDTDLRGLLVMVGLLNKKL